MAQTVYVLNQVHEGLYGEGARTHAVNLYATRELARVTMRQMFLDAMQDKDSMVWGYLEEDELLVELAIFDADESDALPVFYIAQRDVITD